MGAGASCPYGYPSAAHLRELICLDTQTPSYNKLIGALGENDGQVAGRFRKTFESSSTKSIDLFMARNPELGVAGKYFIAFEIFTAEGRSVFREKAEWEQELRKHPFEERDPNAYLARKDFQGGDWYSYLFDRLTAGLVGKDALPDFPDERVAFITFNYDRSLEYFLYESIRNSFTEVSEDRVVECLKNLRILHVYGQVAPLKWQDPKEGVDYRPQITESLLRSAAKNIKTIYEEKESAELAEAHKLIESAHRIIFLGFGYRPENMEVLNLPDLILGGCEVRGTALNMTEEQVKRIRDTMLLRRRGDGSSYSGSYDTRIEPCDCLMLLRKYL